MAIGLGCLVVAGALAGSAAWRPAPLRGLEDRDGGLAGPWRVRASVDRDPEPSSDGALLRVAVRQVLIGGTWEPMAGRVELSVAEPPPRPPLAPGTAIEIFVSLRADRPPANPGLLRRDRLVVRGLDLRAHLKSFRQIRVRGPAGTLARRLARLRQGIRAALDRHLGDRTAEAAALLLGERARMDGDLGLALGRAGLLHLFAISGLHVGMAAGACALGARCLGASPRVAAGAALAGAQLVRLLVAPAAPVRRAAILATAVALGPLTGRRHGAAVGLGLAVLILVADDAVIVRNPGFALSAVATCALVLGAPAGGGAAPWNLVRTTWIAQLAVAPLLALEGREIPLAGLLLNPIAVPLLGLTLPLLVATVALDPLAPTLAAPAGSAGRVALQGLIAIARLGERWPALALPSIGPVAVALWWMGLLLPRLLPSRRLRPLGPLLLVVAIGTAIAPPGAPAVPRLVALDVGQGDALLLQSRSGAFLFDGGGFPGVDYDIGAYLVVPALRKLGVRSLHAVALSHAHLDHSVGLSAPLERLGALEVWTGPCPPDSGPVRALERAAGSATRLCPAGRPRILHGCRLASLAPPVREAVAGLEEVRNDASLVVAATCDGRTVLLTGDAGAAAEVGWSDAEIAGAILKVGHHGSAGSTTETMLDRVGPRHAIVSVGRSNPWGLPREEVMRRLRDRGVAVYRTDRDGAITVELGPRVRVRGERWTSGRGT